MSSKVKPNEFQLIRVYDAPLKAVWDAWTDLKQVAQWWGPRGFTITTHGKELRPGGFWKYTMHGPDGTDYPNTTIYHEVEKYAKLVYDHGGHEDRPPLFRVTALFSEVKGGKTRLEMTFAMKTAEEIAEIKKFIKQANGNSTWDRLGEFLEAGETGKDVFLINRTFEASQETMFEMWTNPEHVAKWMPPTGSTMKYHSADIRPGGKSFYEMTTSEGVVMYGRAEYLEIEKPNRLLYTQQFTDATNTKVTRHPFAPTWPATMLTEVRIESEGPNQTRVTVRWEVFGDATAAEREMFHQAKAGMMQGWTGSFDKLEAHLGSASKKR